MTDPAAGAASPAVPMPMFPLAAVLFPHLGLPLHVFEPRYRVLVHDCLRQGNEFGVVLIERGREVGGGDERFGVGTVARIVQATELNDGRWLVEVVGDRRIEIRSWLPDDPYPLALVASIDEERLTRRDAAFEAAEKAVRRALALASDLGEPVPPAAIRLDDDPHTAAYQLAALAPVGPLDHQRLLEATTVRERLGELLALVTDAADVLALRLAGG